MRINTTRIYFTTDPLREAPTLIVFGLNLPDRNNIAVDNSNCACLSFLDIWIDSVRDDVLYPH